VLSLGGRNANASVFDNELYIALAVVDS